MGSSTNFFVPHTRGPTKTIAVTATTGATALTTTAGELYNYNVILTCVGTAGDVAFFELGASATTSASIAGNMAIMAGQTIVLEKGRATHIGAIASATKTLTLYATVGMGDPSISGA
jgi:hypothetical protein